MKRLAILLLVLGMSGAVYAGETSAIEGNFTLAIRSTSGLDAAPRRGTSAATLLRGPEARGVGVSARGRQQAMKPSLAESYLARVARQSKSSRMVIGALGVGLGAAGLAVGISMTRENENDFTRFFGDFFGTGFILIGGLTAAAGIVELATPSAAEKEYRNLLDYSDPAQRESAAQLALPRLAARAKRQRIITGAVFSVLSGICFIGSSNDDSSSSIAAGAALGGIAAYAFLIKSPAERASEGYLEETGGKKTPQFLFGVGPRGRIMAGFTMTY